VVHHTAPHIPFKPAGEWNAAKAQLSGTVHCDYPWVSGFECMGAYFMSKQAGAVERD
jgi:fatty acid desaturase